MDLYQEHILHHFKNPSNFGTLKSPTHKIKGQNNTCGDKISIDLSIEKDKLIDLSFTGEGCAISVASMSILSEIIKGMKTKDIKKIDENYIKEMLKIDISSGRINCAMLGVNTIKKVLENNLDNSSCIPCSKLKKH